MSESKTIVLSGTQVMAAAPSIVVIANHGFRSGIQAIGINRLARKIVDANKELHEVKNSLIKSFGHPQLRDDKPTGNYEITPNDDGYKSYLSEFAKALETVSLELSFIPVDIEKDMRDPENMDIEPVVFEPIMWLFKED